MSGGECRDGRVLHTIFFDGWREGGREGGWGLQSIPPVLLFCSMLFCCKRSSAVARWEVGGGGGQQWLLDGSVYTSN